MRLFADYVRGELASGETLPRLPPLRYGARLQYHDERLLVGLEATRYDDQDDIAPFETETDGLHVAERRRPLAVRRSARDAELELFVNATQSRATRRRASTRRSSRTSRRCRAATTRVGVRSRF